MGQYVDDRTPEQRKTHTIIVAGTDRFMSGWGKAAGRGHIPMGQRGDGISVAGWACKPEDAHEVEKWVSGRSDMRRVRVVRADGWRPKATHTHVYVVDDGHPALAAQARYLAGMRA